MKVPGKHGEHWRWPGDWLNSPAAHGSHDDLPDCAWNVPVAHASHTSDPLVAAYVPVAHALHVVWCDGGRALRLEAAEWVSGEVFVFAQNVLRQTRAADGVAARH